MPKDLRNGLFALLIAIILVCIGYFVLDKPIAFFIHHHHINDSVILKWFTYIPEWFVVLVPFFYIYCVIKFCYQKIHLNDRILLAMANSLVIASFLKTNLKFVFGRYWPETWTHNNPSLIQNNAYGFHFFHKGSAFESFPSGHTTVILAVMTIIWLAYPRLRIVAALISLLVIIGLLGMNYHFLSDIIAGAFWAR